MYRYALFDLDGTLTDSQEGILKSLLYAFEKLGDPAPDRETLYRFIGPPMEVSFPAYCGYDAAKTRRAIDAFRERYAPVGVYENRPAPGVVEMFRRLTERGVTLALASSKPQGMCETVCDRFGFTPYFRALVGSPLTEDWDKTRVISETMSRLGLGEAERPSTVMVGDRNYDVEGASRCGIDCIGAEFFGYAEPGELEAAGAVRVVRSVAELEGAILDGGPTLQEEKRALRKRLRVRESRMREEYKIRTGRAIVAAILSMEAYRAADCVSCFVGTGAEVDTTPLLEDALRMGKRLCVPLCLGRGVMEMRRVRSLDELSPGTLGLLEPSRESERVAPEEIGFLVAPCLACDRQGNRIGRGGGYYDRYLPDVGGVCVSPCREFMLQDRVPAEPFDAPIEYVFSERGYYRKGVLYAP